MQRAFRWIGLLLLLVFVLPSSAADPKKKDPKKKPDVKKTDEDKDDDPKKDKDKKKDAKDDDPDALVPIRGYVECKVISVTNGQKITVLTKQRTFNKGRVEIKDVNVDYELADKVAVRIEQPPFAFDDKGQKKKYTKEELDEMKGPDKKLFGYTADMDAVQANKVVRLFLGRPKSAPKTDPPQVMMIHVAGNGT